VKFAYSIPFDRPVAAAEEILEDTQRLIRCIPGCEAVEPAGAGSEGAAREEGVEVYRVRMTTSLGPVRLRATGTARVRRNPASHSMKADVTLSDPRAGSMYGSMSLAVRAVDDDHSELQLEVDVVLASKIGEFAQPILRYKADQTMKEFTRNLIGTV
jgi:carbon monoxide dehydrogenase subunit G